MTITTTPTQLATTSVALTHDPSEARSFSSVEMTIWLRSHRRHTPIRTLVVAVALTAIGFGSAGCRDALFPKNANRTQFDNYDQLRGTYVPQKKLDRSGNPRPALRERLERLRGS